MKLDCDLHFLVPNNKIHIKDCQEYEETRVKVEYLPILRVTMVTVPTTDTCLVENIWLPSHVQEVLFGSVGLSCTLTSVYKFLCLTSSE